MAHIHTKPGQHDATASAFVVRTDLGEPVAVLHMHKKLGRYFQFGGHIELHENPWQTIAHELLEESGYELKQLYVLQPNERINELTGAALHPVPVIFNTHAFGNGLDHFHSDTGFAVIAEEPPKHKPAEGESNVIRLFTRQELLEAPEEIIAKNISTTFLFIMDVCLPNWEQIPASSFAT